MNIEPIAYIRTDFKEKFGIPRQSGRCESLVGKIVFEPKYRNREALRGIEEFSHLWLIFDFSEAHRGEWSPTVRPPRLGGNTRVGVFASRAPYRPNSLGLSLVKLLGCEEDGENKTVLIVSGADLLDMTPIYDIKPYIPGVDCRPDAVGSYSDENWGHSLKVEISDELADKIPPHKRQALIECLSDDPRPSYQEDETREYGMSFAGYEIRFRVKGDVLSVFEVEEE